jgi:hypothetical protein
MRTNDGHRDCARVGWDNSRRQSSPVKLKTRSTDLLSSTTRERVLRRYETIEASTRGHRWRFRLKQSVWWSVVRGTTAIKRAIDIAGSLILLVLLSPLFVAIALLVKLNSSGLVFYRQTRVMKWGRLFQMYKFRSMYSDADQRGNALRAHNEMAGGVTFKMKKTRASLVSAVSCGAAQSTSCRSYGTCSRAKCRWLARDLRYLQKSRSTRWRNGAGST